MTYTINNADGSVLTTISPLTLNTSTSLSLPGYGYPGWVEPLLQNFVYLLQNFSSPYSPSNPISGQLWYNNSSNNLSVYVESSGTYSWQILATESWLASEGYLTQSDIEDFATIDWVESQNYITQSQLASFNYVTESYVASQNFVTASYLSSQAYVNQSALNIAISQAQSSLASSYVTESYFIGQDFITQSYVLGQGYVTESYVAGQNFVTATTLSGYLTANQTITVTGDATGSGSTNITLTLAASGVSPGTYSKVVVDGKGRVISGTQINSTDISNALGFTPLSSSNFAATIGTNGYQKLPSGLIFQWITGNSDPSDNTTPIQTLNWPLTFPNGLLGASVSTYIASSSTDDLYYQVVSSGSNSSQVIVQRQAGTGSFSSTTTPFIIGFGF